ncbi:unnamed protein product [Rotaria sp. Silwood1]|nr:unnamed protein product [Rotaria sp. Silwood1]
MDGTYDCPEEDDENMTHINSNDLIKFLKNHFKCEISDKYIHPVYIQNRFCDCPVNDSTWCDDEFDTENYIRLNTSFQTSCERYVELSPIIIDNRNETDETECQQWPCNNIYTRCDGIWNCPKDVTWKYVDEQTKIMTKTVFSNSFIMKIFSKQHVPECHRGFGLHVWLNKEENLAKNVCLCLPSYYGDQCQYENQRVSLTIQFQAFSDSLSTLFAIIILLIDDSDERIIHSYEQLTYFSIRDCKIKYNIYLLYSIRPTNQTKNYSIHIDIYEKN